MLSEEQNAIISQTGAGTLMGDLLRRYWIPFAAVTELDDDPVKAVRLLGEDLVLYRDRDGHYGLLDRHCPHRRADLSYGWVEQCGLRCNYHGWIWDHLGNCTGQPFEEVAHPDGHFKDKVTIKAYKIEAKAGLLWAYMGPEPAPLVPTWEPFTWSNGFVQIVFSKIPCNWFQCQENSIDPVHFEWLHDNWSLELRGQSEPKPSRHLQVRFPEFEFGFQYQRIREGQPETDDLWTVGRVCLWPNALFTGEHFEWRIPIDDTNTLSVGWFYSRVPREMEPYHQDKIPYWYAPIKDEATGRWITSHVMNQDFVAWVGQGTVSDRWNEHLGESDRGVTLMRKRMLEAARTVAAGGEAPALVRDPERNRCIELPIVGRKRIRDGFSLEDVPQIDPSLRPPYFPRDFPFLAGQPEEIRQAYWHAMGQGRVPTPALGSASTE